MIQGDPVIYDPDSRRRRSRRSRRFVIQGDPVIYDPDSRRRRDPLGGRARQITFDLWTVINQMG